MRLSLADVNSNIRPIPDNEEVYMDRNGLTNIIIDIGQLVDCEGVADDAGAFRFHIEDVVDSKQRLCIGSLVRETLRHDSALPTYSIVAMTRPMSHGGSVDEQSVELTAMYLVLIRLKEKKTDMFIQINVPYEGNWAEGDFVNPLAESLTTELETGRKIMLAILETFQIKDWNLFVDD